MKEQRKNVNKIPYMGQTVLYFPEFEPPTRRVYRDKSGKRISKETLVRLLNEELNELHKREHAILNELLILQR